MRQSVSSVLTASELKQYDRDGYLFVDRRIFPLADVVAARRIFDALYCNWTRLTPKFAGVHGPIVDTPPPIAEIRNPMVLAPRLRHLHIVEQCRQTARQILGASRVWLHFEHALYKSPGGEAVPWHQDFAASRTCQWTCRPLLDSCSRRIIRIRMYGLCPRLSSRQSSTSS